MGSFVLGDFYLQKFHKVIMVNEGQRGKPSDFRQLERKSYHFKICQSILHNIGLSPKDK